MPVVTAQGCIVWHTSQSLCSSDVGVFKGFRQNKVTLASGVWAKEVGTGAGQWAPGSQAGLCPGTGQAAL